MKMKKEDMIMIPVTVGVLFLAIIPKPTVSFTLTAWVANNDWQRGVESVSDHASQITEVSPTWYWVEPDGSITKNRDANVDDPNLLNVVRQNHIQIRPIISNVTATGLAPQWIEPILQDQNLTAKHADAIVQLVESHGYDGVDLDYEGLSDQDLPGLASLVENVAVKLHADHKTLAVSIEPTLSISVLDSWHRIGAAADNVRLMLYSEHFNAQTGAGPLASVWWSEQRLDYALRAIPAAKLTPGVLIEVFAWQGQTVRSGTWQDLAEPALAAGTKPKYDSSSHAPELSTQGADGWYEDEASLKAKFQMFESHGIHSIALWRLGGEDPGVWSALKM